jgi:hypothetical protein
MLAAGVILAACGSAKVTSQTGAEKPKAVRYGWVGSTNSKTGLRTLKLPHAGDATPTITKFASTDRKFYVQIINPKDWVYSKTFGKHIFVGEYTSGVNYKYVRDSKIQAMDNNEFLELVLSKSTQWPHRAVDGFNFVRYGQFGSATASQINAAIQWQAKHHFTPVKPNVPSEATIIESPVGELAPPNSSHRVPGACIPQPVELLDNNGHPATGDPYDALTPNYTIQYSGLNGNLYSHGTPYLTTSCAKTLSGAK